MSYDVNDIGESVSKLASKMSDLSETATDAMKGNAMGDIAGLLALMQNNKGTDLPGLLSLAKERGYDKGWGGEGMFLFVFLILFLFAGGGWGGLNRGQQADFAALAGTNAEELVGLHDRIADARNATQSGFQQMQTWLCESISNVISATRNQGDRIADATRGVGDTVRDCCARLDLALAGLANRVDNTARDIKEGNTLLASRIEIEALKAENARNAIEARITQNQKDGFLIINQRFDQLENKILTTQLAQDNARLTRENETLRDAIREDKIADKTVARLEGFALRNYTPTRTTDTTTSAT